MIRLLLIACLIITTLGLTSALLSRCGCYNPIPEAIPHDTPVKTDPKAVILNQLRQVSELTTSVMGVVAIVSSEQTKEMAGMKLGSTEMLYMGVGRIRAGIEFAKMNEDAIEAKGTTVYLRLPPVRVQDVSLDVEQSKVLNVDRSILLSPWGHDLQSAAQARALEEVRRAALEQVWVRQEMENQTNNVLRSLVRAAGFEEVFIEWETPIL